MIAGDCAIRLVSVPDLLMSAGFCRKVPTEQARTSNGHVMTGSYKANLTLSTTNIFRSRSRNSENGHKRQVSVTAHFSMRRTFAPGRREAIADLHVVLDSLIA